MIHFLKITIQRKSDVPGMPDLAEDWRAFLDWADSETMTVYQLRGYGDTPGKAADDAWANYNDEELGRDFYVADTWKWE